MEKLELLNGDPDPLSIKVSLSSKNILWKRHVSLQKIKHRCNTESWRLKSFMEWKNTQFWKNEEWKALRNNSFNPYFARREIKRYSTWSGSMGRPNPGMQKDERKNGPTVDRKAFRHLQSKPLCSFQFHATNFPNTIWLCSTTWKKFYRFSSNRFTAPAHFPLRVLYTHTLFLKVFPSSKEIWLKKWNGAKDPLIIEFENRRGSLCVRYSSLCISMIVVSNSANAVMLRRVSIWIGF